MVRITITLTVILGLVFLAALGLTSMPGSSHKGPLPPLSPEEEALAVRLKQHVVKIASTEHNAVQKYAELQAAADYLAEQLRQAGHEVVEQPYDTKGKMVRNLLVTIPSKSHPGERVVVVGAHYDSAVDAPGANDNGTGTAAVIELARMLKSIGETAKADVVLALYTNEEPPFFSSGLMGSAVHAQSLKDKGAKVVAMLSLETMGSFSEDKGSQRYPIPILKLRYPSEGNFIGFVGDLGAYRLVRKVTGSFRTHGAFPSEGIAAPRAIPGIDWSDHGPFTDRGYPALMVTDTALYRYEHYHTHKDTPDKVDYQKLARVVKGLEGVIRDLVNDAS